MLITFKVIYPSSWGSYKYGFTTLFFTWCLLYILTTYYEVINIAKGLHILTNWRDFLISTRYFETLQSCIRSYVFLDSLVGFINTSNTYLGVIQYWKRYPTLIIFNFIFTMCVVLFTWILLHLKFSHWSNCMCQYLIGINYPRMNKSLREIYSKT